MDWSPSEIVKMYENDAHRTLVSARVKPANSNIPKHLLQSSVKVGKVFCPVCIANQAIDSFKSLACGHQFCKECWSTHFEIQIIEGVSTGEFSGTDYSNYGRESLEYVFSSWFTFKFK